MKTIDFRELKDVKKQIAGKELELRPNALREINLK